MTANSSATYLSNEIPSVAYIHSETSSLRPLELSEEIPFFASGHWVVGKNIPLATQP